MNDPFFSAVDEAQPVFASKILNSDEIQNNNNFYQNNNNNYINEKDGQKKFSRNSQNQNRFHDHDRDRLSSRNDRDNFPSRNSSHRPQHKEDYKYHGNQPRLPSMLNDIKAPKPLKINQNKPPQSKIYYNSTIPDHFTYAKPYEGV